MNAAQVRAKARAAVKRREEVVEAEEIEGGEINLVPYLDIVTNLMLFLLASISAGFILGQLDTTLPDHVPANATKPVNPDKSPDEQIQLVASVTQTQMIVWSISGLEGTLSSPKVAVPRVKGPAGAAPRYDYPQLNAALVDIAARRWQGRPRPCDSYEVILQADPGLPYETIVDVMDNLRRQLPDVAPTVRLEPVTMPETDPKLENCTPTENYDPTKHFLFPNILFALGFE